MRLTMMALSMAILQATAAGCGGSPESEKRAPTQLTGGATTVRITAGVEAVDADNRLLTLRGPQGRSGTYRVGEDVKRLPEIKVGDTLAIEYRVRAKLELREPTAAEKREPVVLMEGVERGPSTAPPKGSVTRVVRMAAAIDRVDRTAHKATVSGPLGGTVTFYVEDPEVLATLREGQQVVAFFAEELLLSIEPAAK